MRWFGSPWGAPVCASDLQIPTPIGKICVRCNVEFNAEDRGFVMPSIDAYGRISEESYHFHCLLDAFGLGVEQARLRGRRVWESEPL